jgi:hypothetical protein
MHLNIYNIHLRKSYESTKHYSIAVYRRRLKIPLKIIKLPSKTFLGILKNACYKLDSKGHLRHFFKMPSNINI